MSYIQAPSALLFICSLHEHPKHASKQGDTKAWLWSKSCMHASACQYNLGMLCQCLQLLVLCLIFVMNPLLLNICTPLGGKELEEETMAALAVECDAAIVGEARIGPFAAQLALPFNTWALCLACVTEDRCL